MKTKNVTATKSQPKGVKKQVIHRQHGFVAERSLGIAVAHRKIVSFSNSSQQKQVTHSYCTTP
jgi:hypothetical protein